MELKDVGENVCVLLIHCCFCWTLFVFTEEEHFGSFFFFSICFVSEIACCRIRVMFKVTFRS